MIFDKIVRDVVKSLQRVLDGLDHKLTARDNFGPEGTTGYVLTSNGTARPPSYQPATPGGSTTDLTQLDAVWLTSGIVPEERLSGYYRGAIINFSQIELLPDTLAEHGISDSYTKTQVDALIAAATPGAPNFDLYFTGPYGQVVPSNSTPNQPTYARNAQYIIVFGAAIPWAGALVVPIFGMSPGMVITGFRFRGARNSSNMTVTLIETDENGSIRILGSSSAIPTSVGTVSVAVTPNRTVLANKVFYFSIGFSGTAIGGQNYIMWVQPTVVRP